MIPLLALLAGHTGAAATPPHIITVLADDLGWFDTQVHNPASPTPAIGSLSRQGIVLERAYVFRYCSPTRRSFLSGRFPNHITGRQAPTCSNYLPLEFELLSEKLRKANYSSHFLGKGHLGYQVRWRPDLLTPSDPSDPV
jgi:arylsulfatase A-like enzyme